MQHNNNKKSSSTGSKFTKIVIWTMVITTVLSVFASLLSILPTL